MTTAFNGMPADRLTDVIWHKSQHSGVGNCVELAALQDGRIAVRHSRDPHGPALVYTKDEMLAFLRGARDREFDHLLN